MDHTPSTHVSFPGCPSARPDQQKPYGVGLVLTYLFIIMHARPSTPLVVKAAEYEILRGARSTSTQYTYTMGTFCLRTRSTLQGWMPTRACVQASPRKVHQATRPQKRPGRSRPHASRPFRGLSGSGRQDGPPTRRRGSSLLDGILCFPSSTPQTNPLWGGIN